MKFVFKKPPPVAVYCYSFGFVLIAFTMLHQYLDWQWLSLVRNQQIFILGAITVALGSLFNWLLPLIKKRR
jgi:hypothetical protein